MKKKPALQPNQFFLPAIIKIGYQDITVTHVDSIDDTLGSYSNDSHEIKIKNGMPNKREVLNTLLHELLHSIVYAYGIKSEFCDSDKEEKVVNALGNGLTEVLVRNKELVEFIRQSV